MPTPVSTGTPYCTGAQFIVCYDVRWIGDRLQDLGITVTPANVPTDPTVNFFLLSASGDIEAALYPAQKWQPADLQALTGASQASLIQLCADLAAEKLWGRRPANTAKPPEAFAKAAAKLAQLEAGVWIFGIQEKALAGKQIKVFSPHGQVSLPYSPLTDRTSRLLGNLGTSGPSPGPPF